MPLLSFFFFLLFIQYSLSITANQFNSNCSLLFNIQIINQSDIIQTSFPVKLIGNYNLTCGIPNSIAYYKITPLNTLVIENKQHQQQNDDIDSMIQLHTTQFEFSISQSSTIRLCILPSDNDEDQYLCRQIHIGINKLYHFWNLPMRIFYIFSICSLGSYHILYFLRKKWIKGGKKSKPKSKPIVARLSLSDESKHDTFENEKINEDMSGEEEDE
ncbi:hypothetical protein I4U23_009664 [Adineta vaga]|nr:hypothetical protein I4U23_009664 [Adineta vaga]